MACPRYFQSARFGRAGASHPSLPLQFYLLWFPIKLLSSEALIPSLKVEFIPKKIRGREGWLAPATFKARDSEERGQAALPYL